MVVGYKAKMTKNGSGMIANFELTDQKGRIRVFVPQKSFKGIDEIMPIPDEPVLVTGFVTAGKNRRRDDQDENQSTGLPEENEPITVEMMAEKVTPLSELRLDKVDHITIAVRHDDLASDKIEQLSEVLKTAPDGPCSITFKIVHPHRWETTLDLPEDFTIKPNDKTVSQIEHIFGREVVFFV